MGWDRGNQHCSNKSCRQPATISALVLFTTSGGRKGRRQASSGSERLCDACADAFAKGHVPPSLKDNIARALRNAQRKDA